MSGDKPEHPIRPDEQQPLDNAKVGEDLMPVEAESEQIYEEQIDAEDEVEAQEPVRRREVPTPSKEEVRRHNITHLPYISWCPQCVAGRC